MDRLAAKLTVAAAAVAIMIIMQGAAPTQAGLSAAACKAERHAGINACKPVLYGMSPSAQCCERIRVTHLECVCPIITPKLAALINVDRAIRLVQGCGRRVPRHFKCGSITTP
ncbi:Bifunctional inhibitor/lipid-transfer protein/seed storage 2S albumin superfamily protein [Rhynchospora pubera]|uniref:Bifunctional inhibitor/lipid-transfer protein/seed storage 2S albumin superfamily protein n=1 Tax=Rhynchospora pubera TaxID=906938 RepID=A0AAV8D1W7_9POAL|nr:Bifunctional inhibitor/lipid-transfer protein/seed storage 2S albumin superfamily protein [Rhynchospora pubera]